MSGLIESLTVATDTFDQLVHVIKITQVWNSKVSHYRTGKDVRGKPYLILMWSADTSKPCQPLIAPMDNAEAIANQIYAWLKNQEYGREPDHDGSNDRGWIVTDRGPCVSEEPNKYYNPQYEHSEKITRTHDTSFYDVLCVQPYWVEYHK